MTYTAISLFSGAVDGLAIAAQAAGITVTHHIEWDAWCCRVLRMNHPESIVLNKDIHDVHDLPPTDIIFGGSPCQDFSNAGNGAGFAGSRYLWPEMFRIVRANRPRVVIHENVRGGVSKGLLDRISDDLESAGYETTALVFPACVFGAPHERYRMFHIGLLADAEFHRQPGTATELNAGRNLNRNNTASERGRTAELHAVESGRKDVEFAASEGLHQPQQPYGRTNTAENSAGLDNRLERSGSDVVNTAQSHHEDIGTGEEIVRLNVEPIGSNRSDRGFNVDDRRAEILRLPTEEREISQSRLGSAAYGTSPALHRLDPVRDFPGWPAGQGIYQHAYEPARTTKKPGKYAKERIQAHGNAVVWPQAAPIFRAIVKWLDEGRS